MAARRCRCCSPRPAPYARAARSHPAAAAPRHRRPPIAARGGRSPPPPRAAVAARSLRLMSSGADATSAHPRDHAHAAAGGEAATAAAARGANEDEQASLQRELIACRQHAHRGSDLAILRKAPRTRRSRATARAAGRNLDARRARGRSARAAALGADRQYDLVADLQARLHASESNTRGEALIAEAPRVHRHRQ